MVSCLTLVLAVRCQAFLPLNGLRSSHGSLLMSDSESSLLAASWLRDDDHPDACDKTNCGNDFVRQIWEGPNCQGSNFTFHRLSNSSCRASPFVDSMSSNSVCDGASFGTWTYIGSNNCNISHRSDFIGYGVGICINSDPHDPLSSTSSYVYWCNVTDAFKGVKIHDTTPVDRKALDVKDAPAPCPASDPHCSRAIEIAYWADSDSCAGDDFTYSPAFESFPHVTTGKCYFTNGSNSVIPMSNLKITCDEDVMTVHAMQGCGRNARTFLLTKRGKVCLRSIDGSSEQLKCIQQSNSACKLSLFSLFVLPILVLSMIFI